MGLPGDCQPRKTHGLHAPTTKLWYEFPCFHRPFCHFLIDREAGKELRSDCQLLSTTAS